MSKAKDPKIAFFWLQYVESNQAVVRKKFKALVDDHLSHFNLSKEEQQRILEAIDRSWDRIPIRAKRGEERNLGEMARAYLGDTRVIPNPYIDQDAKREQDLRLAARIWREALQDFVEWVLQKESVKTMFTWIRQKLKPAYAVTPVVVIIGLVGLAVTPNILDISRESQEKESAPPAPATTPISTGGESPVVTSHNSYITDIYTDIVSGRLIEARSKLAGLPTFEASTDAHRAYLFGMVDLFEGDYLASLEQSEKAIAKYDDLGMYANVFETRVQYADAALRIRDFPAERISPEAHLTKAAALMEGVTLNDNRMGYFHWIMGFHYWHRRDLNTAREHAQKATQYYKANPIKYFDSSVTLAVIMAKNCELEDARFLLDDLNNEVFNMPSDRSRAYFQYALLAYNQLKGEKAVAHSFAQNYAKEHDPRLISLILEVRDWQACN